MQEIKQSVKAVNSQKRRSEQSKCPHFLTSAVEHQSSFITSASFYEHPTLGLKKGVTTVNPHEPQIAIIDMDSTPIERGSHMTLKEALEMLIPYKRRGLYKQSQADLHI